MREWTNTGVGILHFERTEANGKEDSLYVME